MNLGIVIAVSKYKCSSDDLPGCTVDGQLINALLKGTEKFDDILYIQNKETNSNLIKDKILAFIDLHKTKNITEVFFYYTGHGKFYNNEFYYIPSDFDKSKIRQTSLSNSDLDTWLRELQPKLTVKVVDACESGTIYIKKDDAFKKHLEETKFEFKDCYFMFSSMNNQSSYQENRGSYFTLSFVNAVLNYNSREIRYKHIIDFISDDFESNTEQTPYFVTQGNLMHVFCSAPSTIKELIETQPNTITYTYLEAELEEKDSSESKISLVEFIKKDASKYCTKEEVVETIDKIKSCVESYNYPADFISLYELQNHFLAEYSNLNTTAIGKWLEENKNDYFAETTYEKRKIETELVHKPGRFLPDLSFDFLDKYLPVTPKYQTYISGFDLTLEEIPFKSIIIDAKPKYPNIKWHECRIVFVFSKVHIRFFYAYSIYKQKKRGDHFHESSIAWKSSDTEIKNFKAAMSLIHTILSEFVSFSLEPIRKKFNEFNRSSSSL